MNYVRNPELVPPFIEAVEKDFNQLADSFEDAPSISFKTVYKICTDAELIKVYKCCGTTLGTQEQIVDHIDLVTEIFIRGATRIWTNPSNNIKKQIWGLYMASILYAHQPICDRIKIPINRKDLMVIISQLQILYKVIQTGKNNPYLEFVYKQYKHVVKQLIEKDAIAFVFVQHNHDVVKVYRYIGKAYEELKSVMKTYLNPQKAYNCHDDNIATDTQESADSGIESAIQGSSTAIELAVTRTVSPAKSSTLDDHSTLALMDDLQDLFNSYWGGDTCQNTENTNATAQQEITTEQISFPDDIFGSVNSNYNSAAPNDQTNEQSVLPIVPRTPDEEAILDVDNWANLHSYNDGIDSKPINIAIPGVNNDDIGCSSELFFDKGFNSASADTGCEVGVYGDTGNGADTSNCLDFDNGSLLMVTKSELQAEMNEVENDAINGEDLLESLQHAGEQHKLELKQMGFGSPVKCLQPLPQPQPPPPQTSELSERLAKRVAAMKIEFLKGLDEEPKPDVSKSRHKINKADIKLVSKRVTTEREKRKARNPKKVKEFEVPSELLELHKAAAKSVEIKYGITKRQENITAKSWLSWEAAKDSTPALELAQLHLENKLEVKEGIRFVQKFVNNRDMQILVERADRDTDLANKLNQDGRPKGKRSKIPENHRLTKPEHWDEYFYQDKYMNPYQRQLQNFVTTSQTKGSGPNLFFENYKRKYLLTQTGNTPEASESICIDAEDSDEEMEDDTKPSTSSKSVRKSPFKTRATHKLSAVSVPEVDNNIMFSLFD